MLFVLPPCEVVNAFVGLSAKAANRVASLGSGLGAGTRRNVLIVKKRLKGFVGRRHRFKRLRAAGLKTDRLLRTGGISAMTFGQRALGGSNTTLLQQRRAAAASTCVSSAGASLDLTLMLADGKSNGAADPAFEAHVGVIFFWAMTIWETWTPAAMMTTSFNHAVSKLNGTSSPWSKVYGPAAAVVATLQRLLWTFSDAFVFVSDLGEVIDMRMHAPAYVASSVVASVKRWRWRRVENLLPALASGGAGRGV